jgi:hypothetical protein
MGYKKLCVNCRLTLNIELNYSDKKLEYPCPNCQFSMMILPHRFRPPKKSDDHKWKVVEYLLSQGFRYEHAGKVPENLRDAKEFWERLKRERKFRQDFFNEN